MCHYTLSDTHMVFYKVFFMLLLINNRYNIVISVRYISTPNPIQWMAWISMHSITYSQFICYLLWIILSQSNVPSDTGNCCDCTKLMNDVSRQEINIVVAQIHSRVSNALSSQMV